MKLQYLIEKIEAVCEKRGDYEVFVIEDISQDDKEVEPLYREYSILDIDIEEDSREINLVTHQYAEDENNIKGLSLSALFAKLYSLMPQHADYSLYSSSAKKYDDEGRWYRLDVPLVALGWNDEDKVFGFVQEKSKGL